MMRHVAALDRGSPAGTASGLRFARCMFPTGVRCLLHNTGVLRLLHDATKACHRGMLCCVTVSVACCVLAFVLRSRSDNVTACAGGKFCIHADARLGTLGSPLCTKRVPQFEGLSSPRRFRTRRRTRIRAERPAQHPVATGHSRPQQVAANCSTEHRAKACRVPSS